jgi:uncharacterized protein (TIGR04255 family)
MSDSRGNLPDFTNPPVIEVALAVQFDRLTALRTPHLGLLWTEFHDEFPKTEEYAPRDLTVETFGPPGPKKLEVKFETAPPVPRCWFLNEKGTELIQVQQDAFVHNWRKVGDGDRYPRYEYVRDKFRLELGKFRQFVEREHLGKLVPNQCEVTYVNHIPLNEGYKKYGQVGEVLTVWVSQYSDNFLSEPEEVRFNVSYVIPDKTGNPLGRLHIGAEPAYRITDEKPIFLLKLTARGRPDGEGEEGLFRFLDKGREWIVRGFTSITTPRMHEIWGRRDEH